MRYVVARYNEYTRDTAYRICVTDCLKIVTENTGAFVNGKMFTMRWYDIVNQTPEDDRTADDVIEHIRQGLERL